MALKRDGDATAVVNSRERRSAGEMEIEIAMIAWGLTTRLRLRSRRRQGLQRLRD